MDLFTQEKIRSVPVKETNFSLVISFQKSLSSEIEFDVFAMFRIQMGAFSVFPAEKGSFDGPARFPSFICGKFK